MTRHCSRHPWLASDGDARRAATVVSLATLLVAFSLLALGQSWF
jgi:hypothetical protein